MLPKVFLPALLALLPLAALAADADVAGKKLVVLDGGDNGKRKLAFIAKGAGVAKGVGEDPSTIHVSIDLQRGEGVGGFRVPAGSLTAEGHGWRQNDGKLARYLNGDAQTGQPTYVRNLLLRPSKLLKVTTLGLGDTPIPLDDWFTDTASLRVSTTVVNEDEHHRFCTTFSAENISVSPPTTSGRRKLVAKKGEPAPCPGLVLSPPPPLPLTPPVAPYLYFDGTNPAALADLLARMSHGKTSGFAASFRAAVDGSLATLATASDDTRSKVAKAAGLLHILGEAPPAGSGFASYRDVAVAAMLGVLDRTPLDSVEKFLDPPANLLDVLRDSGRLQSMAEAYDFLRGSGVDASDDASLRALIASWADSYVADWNLIGDPFGVFPGHRDNWAVKGGSALVTAALALPDHPSAPTWLVAGMTYLNESLRDVVMAPGWYSESPHYVNYSLNNLASTAWHVWHAAGISWFDDLAPLVDTALALRQPDGESAAFEEGVPNVFPHDVLAHAYPARAPHMLWAWEQSSKNPVNYDNQQIHSVTRFLVTDLTTVATAPTTSATTFLDGDTHAAALRSGWNAEAVQITTMAALDHSSAETFASRHNMENPLDLTLFGAGALLLPTASGGPQVTSSANRAVYLEPASKNIPLVDGNAPYLRDPLAATLDDRLDSHDSDGLPHDFMDAASLSVPAFAVGVGVERTVALVAGSYGVVVDRFDASETHTYGSTWRGRGTASSRSSTPEHVGVDYAFPDAAAPTAHLSIDTTGTAPLTSTLDTGLYAPAWGVEEVLAPLRVSTRTDTLHVLTLLRPRASGALAGSVMALAGPSQAGFRLTDGSTEDVLATANGVDIDADGVRSDARLVAVRRVAGQTERLAMVRGTYLDAGPSGGRVDTSAPATLSVQVTGGGLVLEISPDTTAPLRLTVQGLPGIDGAAPYSATLDGAPLQGSAFSQSGSKFDLRVTSGGTLILRPL